MYSVFTLGVAISCLTGCGSQPSSKKNDHIDVMHTVSIRDVNGTDLLSDDDIVSYDAREHVITLKPNVRDRIKPSQPLVGGSEFSVLVDGATVYSGRFTTSLSSQSIDDVVIDLFSVDPNDNRLRISLGYPTREFYTANDDPRDNSQLISALQSLGKTGG